MSDSQKRVGSGELFPTDEPVGGEALIGRADDVDAIASSLLGAINVVLAGPSDRVSHCFPRCRH
jgi:hypothetical protein